MPEKKKVAIKPAKGRPMLNWVGKRPLRHVTAFPAQIVEVTDCGEGTIDASAGAGPPSAWRKIRHSSGVCCKASVKVKSPAGGLFAGQLSVDEPEHASNQSGATAMQRTLRMVSSAAYRVRSVFAPANSRPAATRVASAPRER